MHDAAAAASKQALVASTFTALEGEAFFQGSAPDEVPTSTLTMTPIALKLLSFWQF